MSQPAFSSVEVTQFSDGTYAQGFIAFCVKIEGGPYFAPGEQFSFPKVKKRHDLRLVRATVVPLPENAIDPYNSLELCVIVHVDSSSHRKSVKENSLSEDLKMQLRMWLTDGSENLKVISYEINEFFDSHFTVSVSMLSNYLAAAGTDSWLGDIVESPFLDEVWKKPMGRIITEGVCYSKSKVPDTLRDSLRDHIDDLAKNTVFDFHPNSNDVVRDLVHPALYPYIKGISPTTLQTTPVSSSERSDFWQRPYEDSKYQWLPTPFQVSEEGKSSIMEYVNNLDREKFPQLYKDLEKLFEICLPYFEEVWSYAKAIVLVTRENPYPEDEENPIRKEAISFKAREFQVITKIVEYQLKPGQSYEGVWHAEGMSHENIVMTAIYFLDRDQDITGGDLMFKRAFTVNEEQEIVCNIPQDVPMITRQVASEGFVPLGRFPTEEGYLLVFPNCHIHKIAKMVNTCNSKSSSRRIVVFFFVNPERKIISTREVLPQQNIISLSDAKAYRLELMAERKFDKDKLNIREVELCEH